MFFHHPTASATFSMNYYVPLEDMISLNVLQLPPMDLPPLPRRFFVPPLADKPQNPIMDTLKRDSERQNEPHLLYRPPELNLLVVDPPAGHPWGTSYHLWSDALTRNSGIDVRIDIPWLQMSTQGYRTMHCRGIGCVPHIPAKHLQQAFFQNRIASFSRLLDTSAFLLLFRHFPSHVATTVSIHAFVIRRLRWCMLRNRAF